MNFDGELVPHEKGSRWRTILGYVGMVVATVAIFLWIRSYGESFSTVAAPPAVAGSAAPQPTGQPLLRVLLALTVVIAAGQLLAKLFVLLGQPPVIGEVMAGILLGPSFLGTEISSHILPASVAPYLSIIAQLGVILYMFLVGLDLNLAELRHQAHAMVATSHASILLPFILGSLLSLYLYPEFSGEGVPFTHFALFLGIAMSITAFPVLARILSDRGLTRTKLGAVALSCAALGDVTAWCLLAFVVGVAKAQINASLWVAAGTVAYVAFMFLIARPIIVRVVESWEDRPASRGQVATIFIGLLLSALSTEAIGIHAIFGAFLFGAMIPHESRVARTFTDQLEQLVTILLLPAFFAFTGMRTRIDLVANPREWSICALIMLVATVGKFGGTLFSARLTGLSWRESAVLGTLMNTRGLMELIVLNIGLELNVISPSLFAMMVLMALVTTMTTAPVLHWLSPEDSRI